MEDIELSVISHEPVINNDDSNIFINRRKWYYRILVISGVVSVCLFSVCLCVLLI